MDLSIITINYNSYELTKETIKSIFKYPPSCEYEIFLVDNNSHDDSLNKLKVVFDFEIKNKLIKLIPLSKNKGFANGNNEAIKQSNGDFILLLNNDTEVLKDSLTNTFNYIYKNENIGALGCKIILPDGSLDMAARRNFPNPKNSFYKLFGLSKIINKINGDKNDLNSYNITNLDENGIYEVDSLVGAFMLLRKTTLNEIGLLDESFFMYGEDIDLCYRIKESGWKVVYYGKNIIIHHKGTSKKQKTKLIYHFYKSMYIFFNKHYRNSYSFLTKAIIYFGIGVLFIIKVVLNIFKRK
ncbi:MAG: glycosyltransferase family 2 protein [Methanobrevibacter sp.]|jgi:GT2 family glycosyltransferase|nr:glycosyltransferase family 2 protein [Candidatus Methanoflexus mossambicus]